MKSFALSGCIILVLLVCPFRDSSAKPQTKGASSDVDRYFNPLETGKIAAPDAKEGSTYYVDALKGNDSWDGRLATHRGESSGPFKTIGKALDRYSKRVKGGNTIQIRAGLYRTRLNLGNLTGATSETSRLTISSYGDGEVIVDASDTHLLSWSPYPGNPNIYQANCDLKLRGNTVAPAAVVLDDNFKSCRPVYQLKDVTSYGRWYYDRSNKKIYLHSNGSDPLSRDVTVVKYDRNNVDYGIYLTGDYVTVSGLTVRGAGSYGIHGLGDHNRIENCTVKYSGKAGIKIYGKYAELLRNHIYGNVILNWPRGNTWDTSGGWPNGMTGSSYARIARNMVHDNGGEGIGSMGGAGGVVIEDNISFDNWSVNIYVDSQPNDIIRRNMVYCTGVKASDAIDANRVPKWANLTKIYKRMRPEGIMTGDEKATNPVAQSVNQQIYSNIIINCAKGYTHYGQATGAGFRNFLVANNTIVMPKDANLGDTWVGIDLPAHGGNNSATVIKNNIVVGFRSDTPLVRIGGDHRGIDLDNNLYFNQANHRSFQINHLVTQRNYDLADWKKLTGKDAKSLFDEPHFVRTQGDLFKWDYHLGSGSPAVGKGDPMISGLTKYDFDSTRRKTVKPSIGALECVQ